MGLTCLEISFSYRTKPQFRNQATTLKLHFLTFPTVIKAHSCKGQSHVRQTKMKTNINCTLVSHPRPQWFLRRRPRPANQATSAVRPLIVAKLGDRTRLNIHMPASTLHPSPFERTLPTAEPSGMGTCSAKIDINLFDCQRRAPQ